MKSAIDVAFNKETFGVRKIMFDVLSLNFTYLKFWKICPEEVSLKKEFSNIVLSYNIK